MKILVSGFDRFGSGRRPNVSSEVALPAIAEAYKGRVETLVLPTARIAAAEHLLHAIDTITPSAVVMMGMTTGSKVRLERRARNREFNILFPDNRGVRSVGKIAPDGPAAIDATLPLQAIHDSLQEADVPVRFSRDAGTFVCNEVMYTTLQRTRTSETYGEVPMGFIHLGNRMNPESVAKAGVVVVSELLNQGR